MGTIVSNYKLPQIWSKDLATGFERAGRIGLQAMK